jgi:hypothetical protein
MSGAARASRRHARGAGATRDSLAALLVAEFELDRQQAERDVDVFLADMEARGLLDPGIR